MKHGAALLITLSLIFNLSTTGLQAADLLVNQSVPVPEKPITPLEQKRVRGKTSRLLKTALFF